MADETQTDSDLEKQPAATGEKLNRARPIPFWLIGMVVLAGAAIFAMFYFGEQLDDSLASMDHGVIYILSAAITAIVTTIMMSWLFFRSQWGVFWSRIVPIVVMLLPLLILIPFKPKWDGNIGIAGLEPRFWSNEPKIADKSGPADLSVTGKFDFPQFYGPNRNGVLLPRDFKIVKPTLKWKKRVGKSWSGFSAVNGFAVTMEQSDADELVTCYDIESGELVWSYRHTARYQDPSNMGGAGPRATPTIHDGKVYAQGGTGILVCLDGNNGELIWKVEIPELLGIQLNEHATFAGIKYTTEESRLEWGRAGSPLIYGDLCIVPGGGGGTDGPFVSLMAFNKNTGEEVWRGGGEMISYGSPAIARLDGKDVITIVNESSVSGHDPQTGQELWQHKRPGFSNTDANCSQPIQVAEDLLVVSKGYGQGGELLRINDNQVETVWANNRVMKTKFTIPLICGKHFYSLSDGILECTERDTGRRVWKKKRFGQGQVLLTGDTLIIQSEKGNLHFVVATQEGYQELEELQTPSVQGICWNTLCLYKDMLLVRSGEEAACFQLSQVAGTEAADNQPDTTENSEQPGSQNQSEQP